MPPPRDPRRIHAEDTRTVLRDTKPPTVAELLAAAASDDDDDG